MKANQEYFRKVALSFNDSEELPHFNLASFRVKKKYLQHYGKMRTRV